MSAYPEHDKLRAVKDQSQACGEFLDWLLGPQNYTIGEYHRHTEDCYDDGDLICTSSTEFLFPVALPPTTKLLAKFFGIDEAKLEEEKRKMLAELRK